MEQLIQEGASLLISLIALIIATIKGGNKKTKTAEEIEASEEAKKQKRIAKQMKKNNLTPKKEQKVDSKIVENVAEATDTTYGQIQLPKIN